MAAKTAIKKIKVDKVITDIVDYVTKYEVKSESAYATAHYCLLDTLGCGLEALELSLIHI